MTSTSIGFSASATSSTLAKARASRRRLLAMAVLGALGVAAGLRPGAARAQARAVIEVWKDPNCGCCGLWVEHLQRAGFEVRTNEVGNTAARRRLGIPDRLGSCHTARVGAYAIEGHVPAADIARLLREKPQAIGLAVPGMPIGSPGMDGPEYGGRQDRYEVLLLLRDGSTRVFSRQGPKA